MRTRHTAFASPPLPIESRTQQPIPGQQAAARDDEHGCQAAEPHGQALSCASASTGGIPAAQGRLQPGTASDNAPGTHRSDVQSSQSREDGAMRRANSFAGAAAALARAIAGRLHGKATATPSAKAVVAGSGAAPAGSTHGTECQVDTAAQASGRQVAARQPLPAAASLDGQPDRKRRRGEDGDHPPAQRRCAERAHAAHGSGAGTDPVALHGTAARRRCGWPTRRSVTSMTCLVCCAVYGSNLPHQRSCNELTQTVGKALTRQAL